MFWVRPVEVTVQRVCRFQPLDARRTPVGLFLVIVIVHLKISFSQTQEKTSQGNNLSGKFFLHLRTQKKNGHKKEEFEENFRFHRNVLHELLFFTENVT